MKRKIRYIACLLAVLMCSMLFPAKTVEAAAPEYITGLPNLVLNGDITGDNFNLVLWIMILVGCAGIAATIFVIRQRER